MFICLFYRQILYELLPANLVPVLKPSEWKQVTLFYISIACVQNFYFIIAVLIVLFHFVQIKKDHNWAFFSTEVSRSQYWAVCVCRKNCRIVQPVCHFCPYIVDWYVWTECYYLYIIWCQSHYGRSYQPLRPTVTVKQSKFDTFNVIFYFAQMRHGNVSVCVSVCLYWCLSVCSVSALTALI